MSQAGTLSQISQAFGNVFFSSNTNSRVSGTGNSGTVSSNSNLTISATNCKLNVAGSPNVNIEATESDIICNSCPNLSFKGNNNKVVLEKNTNLTYRGDGNDSTMLSNTNPQVTSSKSEHQFFNNKNAQVNTTGSCIYAKDNSNLRITGKDATVSVKGTKNHRIQQLSEFSNAEIHNKLEINFGTSSSSSCSSHSQTAGIITRMFGWGNVQSNSASSNANFTLAFAKEVKIDQQSYKLDNFAFNIEPKSEFNYEVRLADGDFDHDSISIKTVSLSEIQVSATKNGSKHLLSMIAAGKISSVNGDSKTFNVDLAASNL